MNSLENLKNNSCAVIPFFNEKETVKTVVTKTLAYVDKVIAIDDGSTDGSLEEICELENVEVLINSETKGKGFSLREGLEHAALLGYKYIITLDADLQHPPDFIPGLCSAAKDADIVVGNRLNNLKDMPLQRILSNKVTSFLLSLKTGSKILDAQCGFRVYKSDVIKSVKTKQDGFAAESEVLILALRKGFKIKFVNIPTIYAAEKSKMKSVQTIIGFIKTLFI